MRVFFVISSLQPGGAERVTLDIADYLKKQGHEVLIFIARLSRKTPAVYAIPDNVRAVYAPFGVESSFTRPLVNLALLNDSLRRFGPDVVVSLGAQYKLIKAARVFERYKVILSERNYPPAFYSGKDFDFVRLVYKKADAVIFQTEEVSNLFNDLPSCKKEVIPNAARFFSNSWIGHDSRTILFVGRMSQQKNPRMLLDSFKLFLQDFQGYSLEICGDGSMTAEMKDYSQKLGISESVHFMGHLDDIAERMRKSLMYISTSNYEGISNSMLEAMSIGMPVVCTDCAGGSVRLTIEDNVSGMIVPCGDSAEMARAMGKIAISEDFARRLSCNARKSMERFSREAIYNKWETLLERLAGGTRSNECE